MRALETVGAAFVTEQVLLWMSVGDLCLWMSQGERAKGTKKGACICTDGEVRVCLRKVQENRRKKKRILDRERSEFAFLHPLDLYVLDREREKEEEEGVSRYRREENNVVCEADEGRDIRVWRGFGEGRKSV